MGANTKIEWTHHTFNPWIGCTKVHAGCTNCYAEAQNGRWAYNGGTWGKGAPRKITSVANWQQPLKWARDAARAGERRRVFCASLADVLDEEAPPDAQARLWDLIRRTALMFSEHISLAADVVSRSDVEAHLGRPPAGLDWLLLTKRPERWEIIPKDVRPLVWLGTSISDQATADEWVPRLLKAEGFAKRFLSIEPQVGLIGLASWLNIYAHKGTPCCTEKLGWHRLDALPPGVRPGIDWVICGGESGPGARPFDIAWARNLRDQCSAAGVPFFCKQFGPHPVNSEALFGLFANKPLGARMKDRKGGDWSEWPADLRVREFPRSGEGVISDG